MNHWSYDRRLKERQMEIWDDGDRQTDTRKDIEINRKMYLLTDQICGQTDRQIVGGTDGQIDKKDTGQQLDRHIRYVFRQIG